MDVRIEGRETHLVYLVPWTEERRAAGEPVGWLPPVRILAAGAVRMLLAVPLTAALVVYAMLHGWRTGAFPPFMMAFWLFSLTWGWLKFQWAVTLDEEGLTAWHWGPRRRVLWSDAEGIVEANGTFRLCSAKGDLWLTPEVAQRIRLCQPAAAEQPRDAGLSEAGVEAAAGLDPGQSLKVGGFPAPGCSIMLALLPLVAAPVLSLKPLESLLWILPFYAALGVACVWAVRAHPQIRYTAVSVAGGGLRVRDAFQRWHGIPWSAVLGAGRHGPGWAWVSTTNGMIHVNVIDKSGRRLYGVVERVVAARKAGAQLPDTTPIPAGAISRMTGEAGAERGISEAEVMNEE